MSDHWDWVAILAVSAFFGVLWASLKQLEKLNAAIGGLRCQIEKMEERHQLIADRLHSIACDTKRMPKVKREGDFVDDLIAKYEAGKRK